MNLVSVRLLAKCVDPSGPPFVAILGPPGSGKTPLLRVIYRKLQARKDVLPLFVNFRQLSLGSELQMEEQLKTLIAGEVDAAHVVDISHSELRHAATLADLLEVICRCCRRRIVIIFDQFDSVPHYFSRAVSRQIRSLYERAPGDADLSRLGSLIAGVISVFNLKRETDSAFSFFTTEALPPASLAERISAIEDQKPRTLRLSPPVLKWLAEYSGPDPAFLAGILKSCDAKSSQALDVSKVSALARKAATGSSLLRDIALHLWRDPYLLEIVKQLLSKKGRIPIPEPVVDVPLFQLMGVVRVDGESYVFRNRMVEKHSQVISAVLEQCGPSLTPQQVLRFQVNIADAPGAYDVLLLESCKRALRQADSMEHVRRILKSVWRQLREGEDPDIECAVEIDGSAQRIEHDMQEESAGFVAWTAARRLQRTSFGWDPTRVSVCVPIKVTHATAYLCATLVRSQLRLELSEAALVVWASFLSDLRTTILGHAVVSAISSENHPADIAPDLSVDCVNGKSADRVESGPALKALEDVLIQVTFEQTSPAEFVRDLIDRAKLQGGVRIAAIRYVTGAPDAAIRRLLRWALETGRAPDDPTKSVLERLATGILDELGIEQRRLLLSALLQLPLPVSGAVDLMAAALSIPTPASKEVVGGGPALLTAVEPETQLQTFLRRSDEFLDVGLLAGALARSHAVCLISIPEKQRYGTGVFVGEDLIITNYHVLEVEGRIEMSGSACVQLGYTSEVSGATCRLHRSGLVAASPTGELDYAIVRLAEPRPGGLEFGKLSEPRGKAAVHILQHPRGESMKLSLSHNGLVSVDRSKGTLTYVTTTAGGSSGAPCFDEAWNLIAIHRAERATSFGSVREGILIDAIRSHARL